MYEELIHKLRCESCVPYATMKTMQEAADAIAELNRLRVAAEENRMHWQDMAVKFECDLHDAEGKIPKWVSVTERLPDTMKDKSVYSGWSAEIAPSDDVLCYLGSEKRQTVAWYSHTYGEWTTVDENTVYKYGEVTHWMPIPKSPKEE